MPHHAKDRYLYEEVREAYSAVATKPTAAHPFPVGRQFAEELGYPPEMLARFPAEAVDAFTGVSAVSLFAQIPPGALVLDLGCGAGLDTLIAAQRTGPQGQVIGVDFSPAMLRRAQQAAATRCEATVIFCCAAAEHLPLRSAAIDVALINGIFNLNPFRENIFQELARVVRPGGAVYAAELILTAPLPPVVCTSKTDWFA